MVKILITLTILLSMVGCDNKRIHTVYDKNYIPVNVVPAPPQNVQRPELPVQNLTDSQLQDDGELVKAYKDSLHMLMTYTRILELIYKKYDTLSIDSNKLFDVLQRYNANNVTQPLMMSSSSSNDNTSEIVEHVTPPNFNFEHEYQQWKIKKDFDKIQEQINTLNENKYKPEDN